MTARRCAIFNPASGRGRAKRRLERLRRALPSDVELWPTRHPGHARALAGEAVAQGFATVIAAGGDGTVHEVADGLLAAGADDVTLIVAPIGSANDYAWSLRQEFGAAAALDEPAPRVDVGRVRDALGRESYFVCNLGVGFNGTVTLASREIRRLRGLPLYALAALRALRRLGPRPVWQVRFDDLPAVEQPTLMLSVLLGRREGNFQMAPDARLSDGLFHYVQAGDLSRREALRLLPRVALAGPPAGHPKLRQGVCRRARVQSPSPLCVHVDGEMFCTPDDGVMSLEIELLPARLPVRLLAEN